MVLSFFISDQLYSASYGVCERLSRVCECERVYYEHGYWYHYTAKFDTLPEFLALTKHIGITLNLDAVKQRLEECLAIISNPPQSDCYFSSQWRA